MTDAEFYFQSKARDDYYDMFFENCRRFHVYWPTATEKEKVFVEEVTRVSYERKKALENGMDVSTVRNSFE